MTVPIEFTTARLRLRCWRASDREPFAALNSFTAVGNLRSWRVMQRIGMRHSGQDFDHPALAEGHPLRRHCLYRLTR